MLNEFKRHAKENLQRKPGKNEVLITYEVDWVRQMTQSILLLCKNMFWIPTPLRPPQIYSFEHFVFRPSRMKRNFWTPIYMEIEF